MNSEKQKKQAKTSRNRRKSDSSDSDNFENFLSSIKKSNRKPIKSSSESDKDFVVPDDHLDSSADSFNCESPILDLKSRLLRKKEASKVQSESDGDSLPDIDTPISRNPKSKRNHASRTDWRKSNDTDDSDSEPKSTNKAKPSFIVPKQTPKTNTVKEPKSTKKASKVPQSFQTPMPKTPSTTLTFLSSLTADTPIERCHPQVEMMR